MLLITLLLIITLSTKGVYVHKAGVTTQIIPCKRMYIGKTNSTEKISTSSYSKNRCDPLAGAGRLEIPSNVGLRRRNTNYWCPSKANMYEYLQVSLKEGPTKIGGFLMQGTVTEFEVRYSLNDVESQYFVYREKDGIKKFNNTVDHIFDTSASKPGFPVYKHFMYTPGSAYIQTNKQGMSHPFAQHVRFYPKKWKEGAEILMKVDLLECIACGDGFTDRTEECDDGNMVDGDGCSGADAVRLGYPKPCTMETHLGQFWCEDMTDGPRRGNAIGDCLYRTDHATGTTVGGERYPKAPQKRYYAARHYIDRGGISTGGYNSGILPLCDGVVCDGQNPYG